MDLVHNPLRWQLVRVASVLKNVRRWSDGVDNRLKPQPERFCF